MRKLIECGLFYCYKSRSIKWLLMGSSILAFFIWCYTAFRAYGEIMQLANPSATYCLYGNYLYYLHRFGVIFSLLFILSAALPFFMERQANGIIIMKSLPESALNRCIAHYVKVVIISLISLLMMLCTIMAAISITDLLFPELSLSLYERRLQFLEYGIRLIVNITSMVLIQTSAHLITGSVYVPIIFGGIMAFVTDGIYNPFTALMNSFEGNIPLF